MTPPSPRPQPLHRIEVIRVRDQRGSRIEPPMDDEWDQATKLAWQAAVVALDTGLDIAVTAGGLRRRNRRRWWRPRPRWQDVPDVYSIHIGTSFITPLSFYAAWTLLNGISAGARAARAVDR